VDGWLLKLFGFTRTLEELDEIDVTRVTRALDALSYDSATRSYLRGEKMESGETLRAREMLALLPDNVRANIEEDRRNLRRYSIKRLIIR
jgi:hypothetical protein